MFRNLDFSDWLRGLIAATVSGGSAAVVSGATVGIIDPDKFGGAMHLLSLMGILFVTNGAMGFFLYLKQKPVPELKTVTTTVQTTERQPQAVVQTTIRETHQEPVVPAAPLEQPRG